MNHKIIVAGFGGQGVLSIGIMLAYSAMTEGREVSWLPSYGPEMRGGTANCSVNISDKPVASPIVTKPNILIVMNTPSLAKFENAVEPGGTIIVNSSLIDRKVTRTDVKTYYVPANEKAAELGTARAANIYILGVLNKVCGILSEESVKAGIAYNFKSKPKLVPLNEQIYEAAYHSVEAK